ncbi:MAG TPA: prolyl oligopeptidase family serine peptidase [Gemmatimonadales bacterium]|jgi:dipeptidyl aminopeptidase/acylaminoacyl peptidase|nr:prolyl oligopeptidase family serine peptidase [Gemmatimonadales bacterium]
MRRWICFLPLALPPAAASAQEFQLTVPSIMRGPDLVGTSPSNVRFSADGRYVYFRWRSPGVDTLDQDYRVPVAGGDPERLPRLTVDTLPMTGVWSPDLRNQIVVLKGDLWIVDRAGAKRRLTQTQGGESNPSWSADGRSVYFTRDNNAWSLDLGDGRLVQRTDIRRGPAPRKAAEPTGQKDFLKDQQRELFDFIRRLVAEQAFRADTDTTAARPMYLGDRESASGIRVSPDGKFALVQVSEQARGDTVDGRRVQMPVWVTESGYVETRQIRTKVGDEPGDQRAAIIELATGKVSWVDSLATVTTAPHDARPIGFSPNARHALVWIGTDDFKDDWLVVVDLPSLETRAVVHRHDDAWLGTGFLGLGSWTGWLDDETVYFGSEETGYAHLYTVPAAGGTPRALTSGQWEVHDVELSPDRKTFYLHTNEGDFGQVHFYAIDVATGRKTQLTVAEGRQDVVISPDGRTLALRHSTANHPPELYFQPNRAGAEMRRVTRSTTAEWRNFPWITPEIVMVPARDGAQVPARLYRPMGVPSNRAAVIFVHGAGYLQNVHKWWSSYYREYMFHHLLASRGFTVLDLDYRGSAGQGRDWRTAIYRHMGGKDLDDQVDGARWLVRTMGVDSSKIGIYGGSYGGFITLMAMFTQPGVFAAGAALRPVTDWAHYNHGYTGRILNLPQGDTLAYKRSSPIYFAEHLAGRLLICHGMVDDNVHFQDTARLVQRLIELGKEDWEVAMYPVEPHGFRRNDSWTDEYRRIFKLFEEMVR